LTKSLLRGEHLTKGKVKQSFFHVESLRVLGFDKQSPPHLLTVSENSAEYLHSLMQIISGFFGGACFPFKVNCLGKK
jgi:hypothetical protein